MNITNLRNYLYSTCIDTYIEITFKGRGCYLACEFTGGQP
jgi:hypothetical protein